MLLFWIEFSRERPKFVQGLILFRIFNWFLTKIEFIKISQFIPSLRGSKTNVAHGKLLTQFCRLHKVIWLSFGKDKSHLSRDVQGTGRDSPANFCPGPALHKRTKVCWKRLNACRWSAKPLCPLCSWVIVIYFYLNLTIVIWKILSSILDRLLYIHAK